MVKIPKTRRRTEAEPQKVYELRVTLMETDPPIWRRIRVRGETTLASLDRIIQTAMGWTNSHLHTFTAGGVLYAEPSDEWEVEDERRTRLAQVAVEEGEAFVYEYDLGDSWRHQVVVEGVRFLRKSEGARPVCLAGERACPAEDSGGIGGYYEKLACLADPDREEREDTKVWIESMTGGPYDPEAFDLDAVNRALARLR
jgi:hypothetical protein